MSCPASTLLLLATTFLAAHPISREQHDRTVYVRIAPSAIFVEYTLGIDEWTLAKDLVPFSAEIEYTGEPQQLYQAFARIYGPRIAQGLLGQLDGQAISFTYTRFELRIEDHLKFTFHLKSPLQFETAPRRLQVTDSNFVFEKGVFRLAVKTLEPVALVESTAAMHPLRANPIIMDDFTVAQDENLRTAKVTFVVPSEAATTQEPPEPVADVINSLEKPGFWEVIRSGSIRRLLDSELGLALVFCLAFVFGAAHALQPGHGKTLVAAYLVGEQGTIAHAFFLGLVTTLTHTSVVILLALIVPRFYPQAESEVTFVLSLGCGIVIILMAFWLLLRRLSGQADHVHLFGGHHHHSHDGGHDHHHRIEGGKQVGWWALVTLGMTGGMVPCVDALALLTATWVMNQMWLGLPLILAFSMGLASVLVALGVLTVKFRRFASSRWGEGRFVRSLPIAGALLTLALGVWMCQDALAQRQNVTALANAPTISSPR